MATKIDKTQLACSNLTFEAGEIIVAADFKLDSYTNLATGLVILQLSDVYRLFQF